ncbi:hypothetical protein [Candidatus Clostridium radicumherbarum]|uniref:Uncharacterized protein n=1 Tax=Candidatus Clostridium radicumherbarum TaxID=3381662 RepID=A0ABW8U2I6_9CLOT
MEKFFTVEEREKLYNEIWEEPVSIVSKRYSISDTTLRKRCNKLNIPLPPRGYWEKVKAGQEIKKPELPKVFGKYLRTVRKSIINYKYNANELTDEKLHMLADGELSLLTDETKMVINKKCAKVVVKGQLRSPHQLILNHQQEMLLRKQKEKELKERSLLFNRYSSSEVVYKNFKSALPIHVSDDKKKRIYRILDAFFKKVEELDGNILVEPYVGKDVATVIIGRHHYDFEVKEDYIKNNRKKRNGRDATEGIGSIMLTFTVSSSYGSELTKCLEYRDSEKEPLEKLLNKIIYDLFVTSNRLDILEEISRREIERRWEEEKRQWQIEELRKKELERISKLESEVSDWDKAQKMRGFADSLNKKIDEINDEVKREKIVAYIKWIRDKADWVDPLVSKEDELLDRMHNGVFSIMEE